jgi:Concanavalin A-like lectin/glucanases superfamily
MTALLVVILPFALFAIVALTCFVGCGLSTTGTKQIVDYQEYQQTVTTTNGLVAFWPLNDASGTIAVDLGPHHFDGTYTAGPNVPVYNAAQHSDASPGTFTLKQPNIVVGDTVNNNGTTPSPCVLFNGGYVKVGWQAALGPPLPAQFTLEAWVVPNWTLADAQANPSYRAVVGAATGVGGFVLFASTDNLWAAAIGVGSKDVTITTGNNQTIVQGSLYFLVVTYDGATLTLWVNPADTTQPPDGTAAASGYVPLASPLPLYIGTARPDLPTPLFPFNGRIQDVAFYNVVLDGNTIETHYLNGSAMQDP